MSRVISGGQTGVDRSALDVALELGIPCGGWCPRGRRAEDGPIDPVYPLTETPWDGYPQRTEWNVRDSDGTLILTAGPPDRGTGLTAETAARLRKPCLVVDLRGDDGPDDVRGWLAAHGIDVLNVAGPRESSSPGIGLSASRFLRGVLDVERFSGG